ncbi:MAG TPA: peptidase M48, partial [Flavobacteriaceae bacterium]|nr:peptidase M48 [Flavobacteriaceae bacterium]
MTSQQLFYLIIFILVIDFIIDKYLDYLNAKHFDDEIPMLLDDVYDKEAYQKSQHYKKENFKFSSIISIFSFVLTIAFFFFDGFAYVDQLSRSISNHPILITLIFFGIIMLGSDILTTPLAYYQTFVIEE